MNYLLILAAILAAMVLMNNLISCVQKEKKVPGNCLNCPEYRYCGGGKPRCVRRSEKLK